MPLPALQAVSIPQAPCFGGTNQGGCIQGSRLRREKVAPCSFPGEHLEWGTVFAGGWVTSLMEQNPEGVLQQILTLLP